MERPPWLSIKLRQNYTFFNNLSKSVNIDIDSAFEITPVTLAYACKPQSDYCSSVFSGFSVVSDSELDKFTKVQEDREKKISDISCMSYSPVKLDCNISETDPLLDSDDEIPLSKLQLEIVDQWSTRIPPPHRRGWQWAMGGLQLNIVQNHKAAILKAT